MPLAAPWRRDDEIPAAPGRIDTSALAMRLGRHGVHVTRRTLQRDLERIARVMPLCCDDARKPYTWFWQPDSAGAVPAVLARSTLKPPVHEVPR